MTIAVRISEPTQKDSIRAGVYDALGFLCRVYVAGAWALLVFVIGAVCIGAAGALLAAVYLGLKWIVTVTF